MSEMIQVPRSDWNRYKRMMEHFERFQIANELIGEEETCRLIGGIKKTTLCKYVDQGVITVVSKGPKGEKFF